MSTLSCLCPRVLLNFIFFTVLIVLIFPHWLFNSIFLPYCLSYLTHIILLQHYIILTIQEDNECFHTVIELSALIINTLNLVFLCLFPTCSLSSSWRLYFSLRSRSDCRTLYIKKIVKKHLQKDINKRVFKTKYSPPPASSALPPRPPPCSPHCRHCPLLPQPPENNNNLYTKPQSLSKIR